MTTIKPSTPIERSLRVLLVEDHIDTLRALTKLLNGPALEVHAAENCAAARGLAAAPAGPPDVVVGDIGLPDGDGVELMAELKARYGCAVIAMTGYGMEQDLTRCQAAGIDRHLLKPVEVSVLRQTIRLVGADRHPD
jgi:CheY-like chemotaxis protein